MTWGDAMLALGGKARAQHDAAPMVSHLGYSTTAFYFYDPLAGESCACGLALDLIPEVYSLAHPKALPFSDADTLLKVDAYLLREQIPVKHYQLDSWW